MKTLEAGLDREISYRILEVLERPVVEVASTMVAGTDVVESTLVGYGQEAGAHPGHTSAAAAGAAGASLSPARSHQGTRTSYWKSRLVRVEAALD